MRILRIRIPNTASGVTNWPGLKDDLLSNLCGTQAIFQFFLAFWLWSLILLIQQQVQVMQKWTFFALEL
jgi:hypothetical protein